LKKYTHLNGKHFVGQKGVFSAGILEKKYLVLKNLGLDRDLFTAKSNPDKHFFR